MFSFLLINLMCVKKSVNFTVQGLYYIKLAKNVVRLLEKTNKFVYNKYCFLTNNIIPYNL